MIIHCFFQLTLNFQEFTKINCKSDIRMLTKINQYKITDKLRYFQYLYI